MLPKCIKDVFCLVKGRHVDIARDFFLNYLGEMSVIINPYVMLFRSIHPPYQCRFARFQQIYIVIFTVCVCGQVMFSYCLSVCLFVHVITFECIDLETLFLACWFILTISRTSLSCKVIGQGQCHLVKWAILTVRHQIL